FTLPGCAFCGWRWCSPSGPASTTACACSGGSTSIDRPGLLRARGPRGAEDAVQEKGRGGALHAGKAPFGPERLTEGAAQCGLEGVGPDIDQDDVERRPLEVESRSQEARCLETVHLRPGKGHQAVEQRPPRRIALEQGAPDEGEGGRVVADERGDPRGELRRGLDRRRVSVRLPEGLDGAASDEVL